MRGTTVLAAALLLAAAPLGAQEYVWTEDRPDGVAPPGIWSDRTLPGETLEVLYRYGHLNARGLRFGEVELLGSDVRDLGFTFVPVERTLDAHMFGVGVGITDAFTVAARAAWLEKNRTTAGDSVVFFNETSGISDVEVDALYEFYRAGPYRGHFQLGALIPVGSVEERGDFPDATNVILPYEMQIGTGSWAIAPGVTGQAMNEVGSVGAQIRAIFWLTDNDRGWRPGNQLEGELWAGYRFNDFVSVSGGVRGIHTSALQGFDPDLETFRDPGDLALSVATERVDLPLGVNLRLPPGSPLAGQRLSVEAVWTVHEESDGPILADDWGFIVGFQSSLDFGMGLLPF
jgi:hypothetical protein